MAARGRGRAHSRRRTGQLTRRREAVLGIAAALGVAVVMGAFVIWVSALRDDITVELADSLRERVEAFGAPRPVEAACDAYAPNRYSCLIQAGRAQVRYGMGTNDAACWGASVTDYSGPRALRSELPELMLACTD